MRLIDSDALVNPLKLQADSFRRIGEWVRADALDDCIVEIGEQPTVDAEPVVHGRWIEVGDFIWKCSVCGAEDCYAYIWGEVKRQDDLYCPKCGAKMDGGDNDV